MEVAMETAGWEITSAESARRSRELANLGEYDIVHIANASPNCESRHGIRWKVYPRSNLTIESITVPEGERDSIQSCAGD